MGVGIGVGTEKGHIANCYPKSHPSSVNITLLGEELLNSAQATAGGKEGSYQGRTAGQEQGRADTGSTSLSVASALPGTAIQTEPQAPSRDPLCPQYPAAVHDQGIGIAVGGKLFVIYRAWLGPETLQWTPWTRHPARAPQVGPGQSGKLTLWIPLLQHFLSVLQPHFPFQLGSKNFIEETTEYLQRSSGRGDLRLLLTEDGAWEAFVAEAELSRADADALRDALNDLTANMAEEDQDRLQHELQDTEKFVEKFPQVKLELKEHIRTLQALADRVDKVHRDCTISKVVAGSTSTVSGVLTLLGLALVPVTAGASLVLLATGMGLGAAAAVTSVSTGIVDHTSESSAKMRASHLVSSSMDTVKMVAEAVVHSGPRVYKLSENCCRVLQCLQRNINAIKLTKANPALASSAKRLLTMGSISAQSGKQVKNAFRGSALVMSRRAWVMNAATIGVALVGDVIGLVKESKHLHKGAKAQSAEELRQQARELEKKLEVLIQIHESLQSGSTQ
ncbi:apolipoprotein L2-like [Alexandromys fortis]|uniref:apolipoprotein L2-like n=1 Tax=Alexandromys fortis TaxID=100897 RepID=UPI002152B055|nr:apolipoprotein L2-like [Microtus fortis]